jgi:hypothetical protein
MPDTVTARYRARDGDEHLVTIEPAAAQRWRIIDTTGTHALLVEELAWPEDRRAQAVALARDYATEQKAFHQGLRLSDPFPRPTPWTA